MKNKLSVNLLLSILLFVVSSAFVFAATELSVNPAEKNVTQYETFIMSIGIDTTDSVIGAEFNIFFDPSVINATKIAEGGFLSKDGDDVNDNSEIINTEGKILVSLFKDDTFTGLNGSGFLLNITFKAVAKNNISEITLGGISIWDDNVPVPNTFTASTIDNGTVNVITIEPIVINEIMQNPSGSEPEGEWIELYNPNLYGVDINGWTIKDEGTDNHMIDNGTPLIINSGDYLVLCRNGNASENGGVDCDYEYDSFTLGNGVDEVVLLNEGGFEVDRVDYDNTWPFSDGASMELKSPLLDNSIKENWREATAAFGEGDKGTPGRANNLVPNQPVLNSPPDGALFNVDSAELNFSSSDDDNNVMDCYIYGDNYSDPSTLVGFVNDVVNGTDATYIWDGLEDGVYYWKVQCSDGVDLSDNSTIRSFEVDATAPLIINLSKTPEPGYNNDDVTLSANITDIHLDKVLIAGDWTGNWTNQTITGLGDIYSFVISETLLENQQEVQWRFVASDTFGNVAESALQSFTVSNRRPVLLSNITIDSWNEDTNKTVNNISDYFDDPDGDTLTYSIDLDPVNIGHIFNTTTGVITLIPDADFTGNNTIIFNAEDPYGGINYSNEVILTLDNVNDAPYFTSTPGLTATESLQYVYDANANDIDSNVSQLEFSIVTAPAGAVIDPATGVFRWKPDYGQIGINEVELKVEDSEPEFNSSTQKFNLTVNSALEITDLDITVDGSNNDNLWNGAVVNARPGSTVQADIELKNMINVDIRGVVVNGTLNTDLGLFKQSSLISNMKPGDTNLVTLEFKLPNIIGEKLYPLEIKGRGEDKNHIMRGVERTIYINVTQEGDDLILEKINLIPNKVACIKNAILSFNITNRGKQDQTNGNTIRITNEDLGISIEEVFSIAKNSSVAKEYPLNIETTKIGIFPIKINITWFYEELIISIANLEIARCINIQDYQIDEDTTPPANWIDLWGYVNDPNYPDDYFAYAVVSESNNTLIDCSLTANRYIDCLTPALNQNGYSDINVSVVSGSYLDYDTFRVTVNPVNDAPAAYNVSAILDEDSSAVIQLNCTDIDDSSLSYIIVSNPAHGALSGSDALRTYKPNANYNGADSFTYKCNDGKADSNIASVGITVNSVLDKPLISAFSPSGNLLIGDNVEQGFSVTISDPDSVIPLVTWYVDGANVGAGNAYTFKENVSGTYHVLVNVTNATKTEGYDSKSWSIEVSTIPVTTYDGTIGDVDDSNVNAFTGLTIINPWVAVIDFGNKTIDLSGVVDVDKNVMLASGAVGINTSTPGFEVFKNHPATITMYGLTYESMPKIYYNSGFTTAGTTECTVLTHPWCKIISWDESTDTLVFEVEHFSVFFLPPVNKAPVITSSPGTIAYLDEEYRYTITATDNENDYLTYSLINGPIGMGISGNVVTWTPTANMSRQNVTISVTDNINSPVMQSWGIEVKEGAKLRISSLDVKVGDKTSKDLNNGGTIGRKAKPGDKVKFDVEVRNMFSSSSDIQIENIEVTITIQDIDDGDDLEESADIDDLDAGDDDSAKLEFDIPTLVDEGAYDVVIEVDAEDENGKDQDIRWELKLEVKKDSHELLIEKATLFPSSIRCDRNPSLGIRVVNIGSKDEDEVKVEIRNDELGIDIEESDIELDAGNDEDSVFEEEYTLRIDNKAEAGIYPVTIRTYYDSKASGERTVDLTVERCVDIVTPLETVPVEVVKTTKPITAPVKPPVTEISFRDTSEYLTLLAILLVILIGGVIFLIGAAVIMARKR